MPVLPSPDLPVRSLAGLLLVTLSGPALAQSSCQWTPAADGPIERLLSASEVIDGRLVLFGGFRNWLQATVSVDAYDPVSDTWTGLADMPTPVTHAGFALDDRTFWVAGGFVGNHPAPVVADVWTYDVDLDEWRPGPPLPAPRGGGGLFRIDRTLHYVGGVSVDRNTDQPDHWVLDLDNPIGWTSSDPLPLPRNHFGTLELGGRGYVIGGQFNHDISPQDVGFVHVYDPASGWSQLASLPYARSHIEPGVFSHQGVVYVAGGRSIPIGQLTLPDVLAYDPLTDLWSAAFMLPGPLIAPAAKIIGQELVLAGGGPQENSPTQETWRRPTNLDAPVHFRVNSGGGALALTENWCGDVGATSGQPWSNSNVAGIVQGTQDDALYVTERSGPSSAAHHFAYEIPLAPGKYRVDLHFAEIYWGAPGGGPGGPGRRVFDVSLEGQVVLDDYDINKEVGAVTADVRTFYLAVVDGALDMSFDASVDRPKLSGFEIVEIDPGTSYCIGATNSTGGPGVIGWTGDQSVAQNDFTLTASGLPPSTKALFLQSDSQNQVPAGSGFLCVGIPFFRLLPALDATPGGAVSLTLDLSNPSPPAAQLLPGSTWNFQLWYRDTALSTTNLTNGLSLTFLP